MSQQTVALSPNESKVVSFEATPYEAKTYQVSVDGLTGSFVAIKAVVEITGIVLDKAEIVPGEGFNITITFSNPNNFDVWVQPKFAFGKSNGDFVADKVLAGERWDPETGIYIDPGVAAEWADLGHPNHPGANMPQFVYDPDGVPVLTAGATCWLKVPANGQATTVKQARLSSELEVKAVQCVLCGEIITGSVEAHYASKHPGVEITCWSWEGLSLCYFNDGSGNATISVNVPAEGVTGTFDLCVVANKVLYLYYEPHYRTVGGKQYLINWKSAYLNPCAAIVPNMINIT